MLYLRQCHLVVLNRIGIDKSSMHFKLSYLHPMNIHFLFSCQHDVHIKIYELFINVWYNTIIDFYIFNNKEEFSVTLYTNSHIFNMITSCIYTADWTNFRHQIDRMETKYYFRTRTYTRNNCWNFTTTRIECQKMFEIN